MEQLLMLMENSTEPTVADCLTDRHWYAFLCSSLISFFAGLLCVLSWRICSWTLCQFSSGSSKKSPPVMDANGGFQMTKTKHKIPPEEHKVGSLTSAQDWAGSLISGQTTTGRILVSCNFALSFICQCLLIRNLSFVFATGR